MKRTLMATISLPILVCAFAAVPEATVLAGAEKKQNNLVSELLEALAISKPSHTFTFTRSRAGWIFISATCKGTGTAKIVLDHAPGSRAVIARAVEGGQPVEAVRSVAQGEHRLRVE